jgi:hypothetical protein
LLLKKSEKGLPLLIDCRSKSSNSKEGSGITLSGGSSQEKSSRLDRFLWHKLAQILRVGLTSDGNQRLSTPEQKCGQKSLNSIPNGRYWVTEEK